MAAWQAGGSLHDHQRAARPAGWALYYSPLVFVVLLASCGNQPAPRAAAAPGAAVPVHVAPVSTQEWPAVYEAAGTVRARTTATISSRVMGYVEQVDVQVGDRVRRGQMLTTLYAQDFDVRLRSAEAGRAGVQAEIREAYIAVIAAKAGLDLAQTTFKRMEELNAKKSISSQEFDEASARLKTAQANYEMARARQPQLDSKLEQAIREVESATIQRDWTRLTAPFDGIVAAKSVDPGNLASPGAPLMTIEQEGGYRLEVSVDESRLPSVRAGQTVEVALDALQRKLNAKVSEIVPAVDAASRTYIVKVDLPADPPLRSGMFGRAVFPLGSQTVLTIPASAAVERGQLQSVFVVEDGAARTRLISIGRRTKDAVEVLSGLSAGEKVVAPVPVGLQDGARLEVHP